MDTSFDLDLVLTFKFVCFCFCNTAVHFCAELVNDLNTLYRSCDQETPRQTVNLRLFSH